MQRLFIERPCIDVIRTIDDTALNLKGMGDTAMAFGFLLGFETTHPGIRGEHDTVLMRLRAECNEATGQSALELLQTFAREDG